MQDEKQESNVVGKKNMCDLIVTHKRPHFDEIAAIWLLKNFGEEKYQGISEAEIDFVSNGNADYLGELGERIGILFVGTGGGQFDEHPRAGEERKKNECATTLVAKKLGIDKNPALEEILRFTLNKDTKKGYGNPFDIASMAKLIPENAIEWVFTALDAKYKEQLNFWTTTREGFEKNSEIKEVTGPGRRLLKMAVIRSDDEQISKFARSAHGGQAAIIIQKKSTGNVQIYTNKVYGLTLYDTVAIIRDAERAANGINEYIDFKVLSAEGNNVPGAENWYFHEALQCLFNGSLTALDVPPTKIAFEDIKKHVEIGINPACFNDEFVDDCKRGFCHSSIDNPCPWYNWGLQRCRKIRYAMKTGVTVK